MSRCRCQEFTASRHNFVSRTRPAWTPKPKPHDSQLPLKTQTHESFIQTDQDSSPLQRYSHLATSALNVASTSLSPIAQPVSLTGCPQSPFCVWICCTLRPAQQLGYGREKNRFRRYEIRQVVSPCLLICLFDQNFQLYTRRFSAPEWLRKGNVGSPFSSLRKPFPVSFHGGQGCRHGGAFGIHTTATPHRAYTTNEHIFKSREVVTPKLGEC